MRVFDSWHFLHPYFASLFGTVHCPSHGSWCKLRWCIQILGMIRSVIHKPPYIFLKIATIPTYQGISIAFLRYITMQYPPSHDLIFMSCMLFCLIEKLHVSWALPLLLLHDNLVSLHILLHWQRHTFAYIMIVFSFLMLSTSYKVCDLLHPYKI